MALEDLTGVNKFIDALDQVNPDGATDQKHEGDDHIRGVKNVLKNQFPNLTGAMNATQNELNYMVGITSIPATVIYVDAQVATKIGASNYATSTVGGTVKMRVSGTSLYIRNDGGTA